MKFLNLPTLSFIARVVVSGTIALAFLGSIAALFFFAWYRVDVPAGTKEILSLLIGVLAREFGDMCGFWFWDNKDQPNVEKPAP